MQDLSLLDQVLDRTGHVFDGHLRIDAVLEVDAIGAEALQYPSTTSLM